MNVLSQIAGLPRAVLIVAVAVAVHAAVLLIRRGSRHLLTRQARGLAKIKTVTTLVTGIVIFALYFGAGGFVLKEFGISLTPYFASATIIGIAVGFGSQGVVQDVVTGLTIIFADLFQVGDMVEISGQTGVVKQVGMRFTVMRNAMGADVIIPNRSIGNVVNYPRGYVRCLVDVGLPADEALADRIDALVRDKTAAIIGQYPGIFVAPPEHVGRRDIAADKRFSRVKLRIWPGRGGAIETTFRSELVQALKALDATYADWMVTVSYEIEQRPV